MEEPFIRVLIPPLLEPLTYRVPASLTSKVGPGTRIEVPLGKRRSTGFVISLHSTPPPEVDGFEIKTAIEGIAPESCFSDEQIKLFEWVADYYREPLSKVIDTAIPPSIPQKKEKTVVIKDLEFSPKGRVGREILSIVKSHGGEISYSVLTQRLRGAGAALKRLEADNVIGFRESLKPHRAFVTGEPPSWAKTEISLVPDQLEALEEITKAISAGSFSTFLLHGVTGSGKTEVYIEAAKKVLAAGRGVLVIVPEIALTPQLIDRFRARFGNEIAVLHSALQKRDRWDSWKLLLGGDLKLAIGARSSVFAPIQNLGLIIVDEEHDSSFKQSEGVRYHARDIAIMRAKLSGCPIVLGSATPSLESFYKAVAEKKYRYLRLTARPSAISQPKIEIVDLNSIKRSEMPSKNISKILRDAIHETLSSGEQSFIMYNRRGFAQYLQCEKCEEVIRCRNCSVTLTYHKKGNSLLCHYCGFSLVPPSYCPSCSAASKQDVPGSIALRGGGTESVYDELLELFPDASIERLDRDAVDTIARYNNILDRVRSGSIQILVGTQMIAKGHDIPTVTLVGVVDCDVGLHMPDFRASEKVFQLLTQASGRAGRSDKVGRVILQTRMPTHASILKTVTRSFEGFAAAELTSRKETRYPPFSRLVRIIASSQRERDGLEVLISFRDLLKSASIENLLVLGPAATPLERVRGQWRYHLILKSPKVGTLHSAVGVLKAVKFNERRVKVSWDIDPLDML